MPLLLLLEDNLADLRKVTDIVRRAGFNETELYGYSSDAKAYLERALAGKAPMPDAILIDLDQKKENGFELLRFWHGNPAVKAVPLVVWTTEDKAYREVSVMFGIHRTVLKHDDIHVLMEALGSVIPVSGTASTNG